MKDSAAKGIRANKQAGQLRNDAAVHGRRSSIGKRDNGKSGLSLSNDSLIINLSRVNSGIIRNNLSSSSNNQDVEAKKRLKRQQQLDKAIKVAEKIPVANKYAKIAKLAQKVTNAKQKKAGMFGNFFGGGNNNASASEIEDANAAQTKGEEYKPEDTEGRYSVKLDKRTKMVLVFVLGGILIANILVCVLIVSAITGGGKESYLASHDNPSESDIEKAYNKDEDNA